MTEDFACALQELIDAAADGDAWAPALTKVETALSARGILLHGFERFATHSEHVFQTSAGVTEDCISEYQRFDGMDIRLDRALALPAGAFLSDHHYHDLERIDSSPIYTDLYRRFDFGRFIGARLGALPHEHNRGLFLTILKENTADAPTRADEERTLLLARILQSAMRTSVAMAALREENAAKASALDHAPFGYILLQGNARVREMNAAARGMLAKRDGLALHGSLLTAADPKIQARLLKACAARQDRSEISFIPIQRSLGRPYVMLLIGLKHAAAGWLEDARRATAIALIADSDGTKEDGPAIWKAAFNLTASEAEVASLLMQGLSHKEIADARGVSFQTVHTQMKSIYNKLGANSQTQASTLLLRAAPFIKTST